MRLKWAVIARVSVSFGLIAVGVSGCSTAGETPTGHSSPPPPGVNAAEPQTSSSNAPSARVQVFHGTGQKDLGTIVVPTASTISWSCDSCGSTNFIINNAQSDSNTIPTNGLNQTHGVDPLEAGSYHTVVVNTSAGPWTVTITPSSGSGGANEAAPEPQTSSSNAPSARVQVFHGTGQKDLGTIVVPTASTISWSCDSCGSTNFIINNAQSDSNTIPTNGLNQTHGVDPLEAGSYHTVVVNTSAGPWTVTITPGE